jgi:hypothetical protein
VVRAAAADSGPPTVAGEANSAGVAAAELASRGDAVGLLVARPAPGRPPVGRLSALAATARPTPIALHLRTDPFAVVGIVLGGVLAYYGDYYRGDAV